MLMSHKIRFCKPRIYNELQKLLELEIGLFEGKVGLFEYADFLSRTACHPCPISGKSHG